VEQTRIGVVVDDRYRNHDAGVTHPERPSRMEPLLALAADLEGLVPLEARLATVEEIARHHTIEHVRRIAATADREMTTLDPDTVAGPASYETARLAAGGVLVLLDAILDGAVDSGLALVRPPGHHAEADRTAGFCLFNNVGIGVRRLRSRGVGRILVLDWDVHHGNGTQHAFEDDPDVLFVSLHQYPFFPGTGAADEVGTGAGAGRTVNVPLPAGCGDGEYREAFRTLVGPVMNRFEPEFVVVSAGFDADARDPLAGMRMSVDGYRELARHAMTVAREHAGGRIALILEGGYDLHALDEDVRAVVDEMTHVRAPDERPVDTPIDPLLKAIREIQSRYWRI
jgi:acetoin utilization deacetylase AcuC-like enzyme